eukprot:8178031-Alexandrium_andersonii.AAC.1
MDTPSSFFPMCSSSANVVVMVWPLAFLMKLSTLPLEACELTGVSRMMVPPGLPCTIVAARSLMPFSGFVWVLSTLSTLHLHPEPFCATMQAMP